MKHDPTMNPTARYGSNAWAAARLGLTLDVFYRKRDDLEAEGFPKRDPLTLRYFKDAVDEWIDRRNGFKRGSATMEKPNDKTGANLDVL